MISDRWRREFEVAVDAVREGAVLARNIQRHARRDVLVKADCSPVTIADFAVQALVTHRLTRAFPDDAIVAEEDAGALRTPDSSLRELVPEAVRRAAPELDDDRVLDLIDRGGALPCSRFWTLDPIDGTQGFVRRGQYVVALALLVEGRVEMGLIGCPALLLGEKGGEPAGSLACAVRGCGAYGTDITGGAWSPLRVSACDAPRLARTLRSFEAEHMDLPTFSRIVQALGVAIPPRAMDSQAKHVVVAQGGADLLLRVPATPSYRDKIWDQAAGSLIVEEAGGRVTDLHGTALDFRTGRLLTRNEGLIASNGALHAAVVEAAQGVLNRR